MISAVLDHNAFGLGECASYLSFVESLSECAFTYSPNGPAGPPASQGPAPACHRTPGSWHRSVLDVRLLWRCSSRTFVRRDVLGREAGSGVDCCPWIMRWSRPIDPAAARFAPGLSAACLVIGVDTRPRHPPRATVGDERQSTADADKHRCSFACFSAAPQWRTPVVGPIFEVGVCRISSTVTSRGERVRRAETRRVFRIALDRILTVTSGQFTTSGAT